MEEQQDRKKKSLFLNLLSPQTQRAPHRNHYQVKTEYLMTPQNRNHDLSPEFSDVMARTEKSNEQQSVKNNQQITKQVMTRMFIGNQNKYTPMEIQIHKEILSNLWEYRYWKLFDNAIETKDWLTVFSFLGQFKQKCLSIARMLVSEKFKVPEIDSVDHRNQYKQSGEIGLYLLDGIIVRVATQKKKKGEIDKQAVKNLHQEFLGANILNNLIISLRNEVPNIPKLRVPLQCLVQYLGYTFLFQADTLCQGLQTLINGPMNITYQYLQQIQPLLRLIGNNLNLKPFKILKYNKQLEIPFSLTLEVHKIKKALKNINLIDWINPDSLLYPHDQKQNILNQPEYYLMNFSKIWPLFIDSNIVSSSGYLRPEIVLSWKKELSNVVFSNVCFEKDEIGELELAEACKYVKQDVIKAVAKLLDDATYFALDSSSIQQIMHENGINMRCLGEVASKFTLECNKRIFEVEMVARTLKKLFYISVRQFQDETQLRELYLDFLNLVFVRDKEGQKFWTNSIYPNIEKYYQYEMVEYPPSFPGGGLLHAMCYHFGIKMKIIEYPFFKDLDQIFTSSHIIDIYGLAKTYDLETCQLMKYCQNYKEKKRDGIFSQAIDALNLLAAIKIQEYPEGTYQISSRPQSFFYSQLAECYRNMEKYEEAMYYSELALKGIPQKHADSIKPHCVLIRCHSQKKQMNRCLQYYEKSLATLNYHLAVNHPLTISVYNTLGFEFLSSNDPGKCEKIFAKSFEISEQALGYMHMNSGKILMQLADLPLPPEKTINFLLQALTILENIESDKEKVKVVCMKISELYHKIGNITKQIQFARRSDHWRMEILALQKLNEDKAVMQLCHKIPTNIPDLVFLVQKSFSSIIKLIEYAPSNNLYKLFISVKQNLPPEQEAKEKLLQKLQNSMNVSETVVDFVKNSLTNLITVVPQLLGQQDFYMGYEYLKGLSNSKFQKSLKMYMQILSIVGLKRVESIFTEFRKTF